METAHLTEAEIQAYLNRGLDPAGVLRVHDHADFCEQCAQTLMASRQQSESLPALFDHRSAGADHIEEDSLVLLAEGALTGNERDRVEAHLHSCEACNGAAEDLRNFREELSVTSRPRRRWLTWATAAAAAIAVLALIAVFRAPQSPPKAVFLASLNDSAGVIGVLPSGELTGAQAGSEERQLLEQALRLGVLPHGPQPIVSARGVLRGGLTEGPAFEVLYPIGDRVLTDRPEFKWSELPGATAYVVKVFNDRFEEVAHSGSIAGRQWRPDRGLARGSTYAWQVTAIRGGQRVVAPVPPQAEAKFQIVDTTAAQRLADAQHASQPSHLLLAALYAREGLRREATAELDALGKLNPGSELINSLRRSLDSGSAR